MSWHLPADALRAYESGSMDLTQQLSAEAHLSACASCRNELTALVDRAILDRTWAAIADETAAPAPRNVERLLLALGVSDHSARLVAATPSLRRSWLLAVATVLTAGVLVANIAETGYVFFLALAPLLPLAGVAAAYGPGIDPTYEIGIAAPMRSYRLLLIRSVAVLGSTISLGGIAALFLPGLDWQAAAWLLPSLALVATCLALSTIVAPLRAAVLVGTVWLASITAAASTVPAYAVPQAVFGEQLQVVVLLVGVGSALALVARREELERGVGQ